jgi:phage baseplate assembly protein W
MGYRVIPINDINLSPTTAIGVKFPFDGNGVFNKSFTTEEQASTNIKSLLLTRKGERYEQPNFGTDLLNALFEPNTTELSTFIEDTITSAVTFWLPYIEINNLDIVTKEDDPTLIHKIKITVSFTVTGSRSEQVITIFAGEDGIVTIE